MNTDTAKYVGWGLIALLAVGFIALMFWFFSTPERPPLEPETPAPTVCPKPELPPTLPETGVKN